MILARGRYSRGLLIATSLVLVVAAALALAGHWTVGVGLVIYTALTLLSVHWPAASLSALLLVGYFPDAVRTAASHVTFGVLRIDASNSWALRLGGLRLVDIALLAMLSATGLLIFKRYRQREGSSPELRLPFLVWFPAFLFALWLVIEVARNVGRYGIAAPGEFRFEYLQLAVIPYLCVAVRDAAHQRRLLWVLLVGTLFIPLALVPLIGAVKGWSVGPNSRFFPADGSLGLLYGVGVLVLAKARSVVITPMWLITLAVAAAGVFVFVDGSRSVWMAAAAALVVAAALRAYPWRAVRWQGVAVVAGFCVSIAASWVALAVLPVAPSIYSRASAQSTASPQPRASAHSNALSYLQSRGIAYVNPSADQDSRWRMALWRSALHQIRAVPIFGVGFGGYWDFPMPPSINNAVPITVQPHDIYLETWLKTGAVGLLLYLACVATVLAYLVRAWLKTRTSAAPIATLLLIVGIVVLTSSSLYMVVYPFAYASLLWTGLALGAAAAQARVGPRCAEEIPRPPRSDGVAPGGHPSADSTSATCGRTSVPGVSGSLSDLPAREHGRMRGAQKPLMRQLPNRGVVGSVPSLPETREPRMPCRPPRAQLRLEAMMRVVSHRARSSGASTTTT